MLVKIVDVKGVSHLVDWEDVALHDQIDTTAAWHIGLSYAEVRVHHCMVLKPVTKALSKFKSKKELIQAFVV